MLSQRSKAVDLGPFDVSLQFCKDVNKMGSILNAFQITQWPVVGFPGVVIGLSQRTSPIYDLCNFIVQLHMSDVADAALLTAEKLNDLTDKKWDDQLQLTKTTFKLANSFYNFNSGKKRKGSLEMMNVATSVGNFMSRTKYILDRRKVRLEKEEAKRRDEEQVQRLAKAARERAIIKEATTCPDTSKNPDYSKVYESEYKSPMQTKVINEKQVDLIRDSLQEMGTHFTKNYDDYREYIRLLDEIMVTGIKYDFSFVDDAKVSKEKTGAIDPTTKEAVTTDTTVNNQKQVWTVQVNERAFDKLLAKYLSRYQEYAYSVFFSRDSDSEEFKALQSSISGLYKNVICSEAALMKDKDVEDPQYQVFYSQRLESCTGPGGPTLGNRDKKSLMLLSVLVDNLRTALLKSKTATAKIWTLDSKYLGKNRTVSQDFTNELKQETVQCSQQLSMADMQLLSLKAQSANNEYNEIIAENAVKQSAIAEAESQRKKDEEEEMRAKKQLAERDKLMQEKAVSKVNPAAKLPNIDGSEE